MRRSSVPTPPSPLVWVRRLALPTVALVLAITLFDDGFDPDSLRADLAARDVDDALSSLQRAQLAGRIPEQLPELASVANWRSPAQRRAALDALRERRDADELYEFLDFPTLVAPLGSWRSSPREVRLREPATAPLTLKIEHIGLELPVATVEVPRGVERIDPGVRLVEGSRYLMTLNDVESGALVAVERFVVLPATMAHDVGLVLAAARDLGPDPATAELLVAVAAMNFGLHQEALDRLATLAEEPGLESIVRELRAIAADELGLDRTALSFLEAGGD